jgi:hypothetical protein
MKRSDLKTRRLKVATGKKMRLKINWFFTGQNKDRSLITSIAEKPE